MGHLQADRKGRTVVLMRSNASSDSTVWIVSNEELLIDRIEMVIRPIPDQVIRVSKEDWGAESFLKPMPSGPDLVILDVENDVDWGLEAIRRLKKARIKAPVVVVTSTFSREFGEKILTEGVRYYFAHDFSASEFQEVVESLLKSKQRNQV